MTVDFEANFSEFLGGRAPGARYASFDYCYNYFQSAKDKGWNSDLADEDHCQVSCHQLGFYLASWGMLRGGTQLLKRSARALLPVVEAIASESTDAWNLQSQNVGTVAPQILALAGRIRTSFGFKATDALVTKTMLGVFGCVPAFDRFFTVGFGCGKLCDEALQRVGLCQIENGSFMDANVVRTLDFETGKETDRQYPKSKIVDMVFFQEGFNLDAAEIERKKAAKARP